MCRRNRSLPQGFCCCVCRRNALMSCASMLANRWPRKARDVIRSQREVGGVRSDTRLVRAVGVAGMVGPPVLPMGRHDARANGTEFDVSIAGKRVAFAIHQVRLESSLPQRAGTPIAGVEAADISARDGLHHHGLHHPRDTGRFARGRQQMHMIGHRYMGVQRAVLSKRSFVQRLPVAKIVGGVCKTCLTIVAALDDML